MRQNEAAARDVAAALRTLGIEARVEGGGVHWHLEAGPVEARSLVVHCFWYERAFSGLLMGINPANARSGLCVPREPYEGPEFLVKLRQHAQGVADGRTRDSKEVVAAAKAWFESGELEVVRRSAPFVDAKRRAILAIAEQLEPALRWDIEGEPSYELWVYGEDRSCKLAVTDNHVACFFFIRQVQVAGSALALDHAPVAVASWLIERCPVSALAENVSGVQLEEHAKVLESDPARWHWLHVRDRINDPHDVLAPLKPFLERLAESSVATTFYSFSSLNRFCFSASSHYPWVDEGLPVLTPDGRGGCTVDSVQCNVDEAVRLIETRLAEYAVRPFFGSAPHHELPALAEALARHGSALRPAVVQRGAWYELEVAAAELTKRCRVSYRQVTFIDREQNLSAGWPTLDDAVVSIRRFCEDGASFDEIAADPLAKHVSFFPVRREGI